MTLHTLELPITGMDCAECAAHVQNALEAVPDVTSVQILLAGEKAIVSYHPPKPPINRLRSAVAAAGYSIPEDGPSAAPMADFTNRVLQLFGLVFGAVLFIIIVGEWLGLFEAITARIPWPLGLGLVLVAGYPVFVNVVRATLRRQVIAHTLMTFGVIAAMAVGEWATAAVVVFLMRVGAYAESFTTERARRAVKDLTALAPKTARVLRDGAEVEVPVEEVAPGETVVVRPGDTIPVDGEVIDGHATLNQAAITGESMPVEAGPGAQVYAATLAQHGSLRIQASHTGRDTTFGKVIQMVEEAEAHRADIQGIADKFSGWYLPVVAGIALLTFLIGRDPLATAAVLVVACSCAFALATPIAILASVGAGAKRGLLIKGGKYLEILAKADVLLIDKTGTLTLGQPQITDVVSLNGLPENELLALAASAERYSEHPLAEAVRQAARDRHLELSDPDDFEALPGFGLRATVNGTPVAVGSRRMLAAESNLPQVEALTTQGKTLLYIESNGELVGVLGAADTTRSEIPHALKEIRALGLTEIELLTGDHEATAEALAADLGLRYQAGLLPEDKIEVVRRYQAKGHTVVMVGDGVNDAPALAQADIGIAMGAAGTGVALEVAHIALMREDWLLVPAAFRIARRTMNIVKLNIGFTAVYNLVGLSLAAFGILPPILAAAAQSIPDIGILANSARLLRGGK